MSFAPLNTNQVLITNAATKVVAANSARKKIILVNHGTTSVFIGENSSVTDATGVLLAGVVGQTLYLDTTAAIYGITASSSQEISYAELVHP